MGLKVTVQVDTSVPGGGRLRIVNQAVTGPAGVGVPAGGTTGQVLAKTSNADYATGWVSDATGAPTNAQYVTLATNGTLTAERVLTAGTGITLNDGGAGAAVTVATSAILPTVVDAKGDLIVGTAADTVARFPVGATTGHVLTVDPLEAAGIKWAAASSGTVSPGLMYSNNTNAGFAPGVGITTYSANFALFTNAITVSPIVLDEAFTVSGFSCWVDTIGSGTFRFAVYNATRSWVGTTKAIGPTTGVSNATLGHKIENITPVTIPAGRYFIALGCTTGGSPRVSVYLGSFWGTAAFPSGNNGTARAGVVGGGVTFPDNIGTAGWGIPGDYVGMSGQIYPVLLRGAFA